MDPTAEATQPETAALPPGFTIRPLNATPAPTQPVPGLPAGYTVRPLKASAPVPPAKPDTSEPPQNAGSAPVEKPLPRGTIAPYSEGWGERALDLVRNSPVGHAVQTTFPSAPDWMKPTTRQGTPEYDQEKEGIRPEQLTRGVTRDQVQQILDVGSRMVPAIATGGAVQGPAAPTLPQGVVRETPAAAPTAVEQRVTGAAKDVGQQTSAPAVAQMAGIGIATAMGGEVLGPALAAVGVSERALPLAMKVFHSLVGAGFTAQMAAGVVATHSELKDALNHGDQKRANELIGKMYVDGTLTALAALGTAHEGKAAIGEGKALAPPEPDPAAVANYRAEQAAVHEGDQIYGGEPRTVEPAPAAAAAAHPPIGATEPETGRPVLQQSPRPEVNQAAATAEHPIVKDAIADAIQPIEGAKISGSRPEKEPERRDEKIEEEGQSPRTVRDYSGYRIAVDSPEARDRVVAALKQNFEVHGEQDNFASGDEEHGFHAHTLNVREPGSPVTHEVQILPREVADAADDDHDLYEKARAGDKPAAEALRAVNEAHWNEFQERQGAGNREQGTAGEAGVSPLPRAADDESGLQNRTQNIPDSIPAAPVRRAPVPLPPPKPPATLADRPAVGGHDGRATDVLTPTRKLPGVYRLVEAADLRPSHNAQTFAENPEYPAGVQERDYARSKEAQNRVIHQAQNYDPAYTVNTNPDAVNGPPVITPDGTVLGGNSRAMSTQRVYAAGQGDVYRAAVKRDAATYGLTPEQVDGMKEPVLVRQVERPASVEEARRLGSELNKSMTGALGVSERAVSAGKSLKPETLRTVADMLAEDDSTLRELLGRKGPAILRMMEQDGAITERERPQFTDADGGLSEEGKTFVERAMLGSVVEDSRLMNAAPKSILNKIERVLGSIASIGSRPDEWNLLPALRPALLRAVAEHAKIARDGSTVELTVNQKDLFGPGRNPLVDALVRVLDEKPNEVRRKFDAFAKDANQNLPGETRMFGGGEAYDAFNHAFGSKLTDEEFNHGIAELADPAHAASAPAAERVVSQQEAGAQSRGALPEAEAGRAPGGAPVPPGAGNREQGTGSRPAARVAESGGDGRSGVEQPAKAPKPLERAAPFREGKQATPVMVRDADGEWRHGTLDKIYTKGGANGRVDNALQFGRVTLSDGTRMNDVPAGAMRAVKTPNLDIKPLTGTPGEADVIARTKEDQAKLTGSYLDRYTEGGVPTIATDAAKELFPEFKADPVNNDGDVAASAKAVRDWALDAALARPVGPARPDVLITTASPGSGKTTGQALGGDRSGIGIKIEAISDSLDGFGSLMKKVIDSGRRPVIEWVYVDDPAKTVGRMFRRAIGSEDRPGIGRTVELDYMARAYHDVPRVFEKAMERFGDQAKFQVVDNSGKPGEQKVTSDVTPYIENASKMSYDEIRERMNEATSALEREGLFKSQRGQDVLAAARASRRDAARSGERVAGGVGSGRPPAEQRQESAGAVLDAGNREQGSGNSRTAADSGQQTADSSQLSASLAEQSEAAGSAVRPGERAGLGAASLDAERSGAADGLGDRPNGAASGGVDRPRSAGGSEPGRTVGALPEDELTRERAGNEQRAAERKAALKPAAGRSMVENAAAHKSAVVDLGDGRKALVLDPDGEGVWHRLFKGIKNEAMRRALGVGESWRGVTLDREGLNIALAYLKGAAGDLDAAGVPEPEARKGYDRMAQALREARDASGGATVLRGDYRADTAREEATHQWQREHGLDRSYALATVADHPDFKATAERVRNMGYRDATPRTVAMEVMAKAMAGDTELAMTDTERTALVRAFLTEAVEEKGSRILDNLPATDPRVRAVVDEVRSGYGGDDERGDAQGGAQAPRGGDGQAGNGAGGEAGGARPRDQERGGQPRGAGVERGAEKERPAQAPVREQAGEEKWTDAQWEAWMDAEEERLLQRRNDPDRAALNAAKDEYSRAVRLARENGLNHELGRAANEAYARMRAEEAKLRTGQTSAAPEPLYQRGKAPKPLRPEDSLALPGMEDADRERGVAAGEEEGQRLSEELRRPLGDISRKAGAMERESPLFFGSEASGQGSLFQRAKTIGEEMDEWKRGEHGQLKAYADVNDWAKARRAHLQEVLDAAKARDDEAAVEAAKAGKPLDEQDRLLNQAELERQEERQRWADTLAERKKNLKAQRTLPFGGKSTWQKTLGAFRDWRDDVAGAGDDLKAMVRDTRGQMDRNVLQLKLALKDARKDFVTMPREKVVDWIDAVEHGRFGDLDEKHRELAEGLHALFVNDRLELQKLDSEKLKNFYENYFPHIWDRSGRVARMMQAQSGKRPLFGSGSFLEHRTLYPPTFKEGVALGLEPKTWNPIDMALIKHAEIQRYIFGLRTVENMKAQGLTRMFKTASDAPGGWTQLDDRFATVSRVNDAGERVISGHYYAPADAARAFNNFVSRGLQGRNGALDAAFRLNDSMNQVQLGLSAFHATASVLHTGVSDLALGLQELSQGRVLDAGKHIGRGLVPGLSAVRATLVGSRMMREYLKPGSAARYEAEANWLARAGGRPEQSVNLNPEKWRQVAENIRQGDWWKGTKGAIPGALDAAGGWLMHGLVPRIKLGVFQDMAANILKQADEGGWSDERTRGEMQKAWDSVDNRYGQMVYDNLFWNRTALDAARLGVRSVGWNLGSAREYFGGAHDALKTFARAADMKKPEMSARLAFTLATPIYFAMATAAADYLLTGHGPDTSKHGMKAYFFPETADGKLLSFPGYMKDWYAFGHDPVGTALHKASPLLTTMASMWQNQDYYGNKIRNEDDPLVRQAWDETKFIGSQYLPFSIKSFQQQRQQAGGGDLSDIGKGGNTLMTGLSYMGFQPATQAVQNSDAMNLARHYQEETPRAPRTREGAEHTRLRHELTEALRNGTLNEDKYDALAAEGKLTARDWHDANEDANRSPLYNTAKHLTLQQNLMIWKKATPEERAEIEELINAKANRAAENDPAEIEDLPEDARDLLAKIGAQ